MKNPILRLLGQAGTIAAIALGILTPLHADVLYSTFGQGDTNSHSIGVGIAWNYQPGLGPTYQFGNGEAVPFFLPQDSKLTSLIFDLEEDTGRRNLGVSLRADNAGSPGAVLETITTSPSNLTNTPRAVTFESSLQPILTAGQTYWLVLEPINPDTTTSSNNATYLWWISGNPPLSNVGIRTYDFSQNQWGLWQFGPTPSPAFQLDGFVVPEPNIASLVVLGLGLVGLRGWVSSVKRESTRRNCFNG